jgi:Fasciclin domain
LLDGELAIPPPLSTALGPFFQSSYSLKYLRSTGLLKPPNNGQGWTYLLPSRQAWDRESLTQGYLESNRTALSAVFESMVFATPFYSDDSPRNVTLLDGTEQVEISVSSERTDEGVFTTLTLNDNEYHIDAADILFENGVAHSVHEVSLPASIQITAKQLIDVGKRSKFVELLESRNLSHVLQSNESYTILVPNMRSLIRDGYTAESKRIDLLLDIHLIPGNPIGRLMAGESIATMAEGVSLVARTVSDDLHFIKIENGQEYEVYVVAMGSTTQYGDTVTTSTILFLDGYISPDWVSQPILKPPTGLKPHIAMLLGAAAGVLIVFIVITFGLYAIMRSPKQEEDGNGHEQRRPLLRGNSSSSVRSGRRPHGQGGDYGTINSSEIPSGPASPIQTTAVHEQREFGRHLDLPQVDR